MDCHCSCCSVVDHSSLACGTVLVLPDKAAIEGPKRSRMAMELTIVRKRRKFDLGNEKTTALSTMMVATMLTHSINTEWSCSPQKKQMVAKRRTETERPRLRALRWGLRAAKPMADADGTTQSRIARRKSNRCEVSIVARGGMPIAVKAATRDRSGQSIRPMRRMKSIRLVADKVTSTRSQRAATLIRASIRDDYRAAAAAQRSLSLVWISHHKRRSWK